MMVPKRDDVTIPQLSKPSKDSLCAVWVPLEECEVASGSYTTWSNENMILADNIGAIYTLHGNKKSGL